MNKDDLVHAKALIENVCKQLDKNQPNAIAPDNIDNIHSDGRLQHLVYQYLSEATKNLNLAINYFERDGLKAGKIGRGYDKPLDELAIESAEALIRAIRDPRTDSSELLQAREQWYQYKKLPHGTQRLIMQVARGRVMAAQV